MRKRSLYPIFTVYFAKSLYLDDYHSEIKNLPDSLSIATEWAHLHIQNYRNIKESKIRSLVLIKIIWKIKSSLPIHFLKGSTNNFPEIPFQLEFSLLPVIDFLIPGLYHIHNSQATNLAHFQ